MSKWSDKLNHLDYADDIIIVANADKRSLQLIMKVLNKYGCQSKQKINKEKNFFYMLNKVALSNVQVDEEVTDYVSEKFPLIYLRCPIGHAKKKKAHFK